jgi:glutamine amidotransferase
VIVCVDYGLGNLASVRNAFHAAGAGILISSVPEVIAQASAIVLPGVGAASAGMEGLRARGLEDVVRQVGTLGRPMIGLCLGMQLLFDRSEEGDVECLGLLPGTVRLLRGNFKVPHIGWNQVALQNGLDLWRDVPPDPYFYFVHSYVCDPSEPSDVAGLTTYGEPFCSAVVRGAVWGTQFHPERSGWVGQRLIRNFIAACAVKEHGLSKS